MGTDIARHFFDKVVRLTRKYKLLSSDHFTVDGSLIEAWASFKSALPESYVPRGCSTHSAAHIQFDFDTAMHNRSDTDEQPSEMPMLHTEKAGH